MIAHLNAEDQGDGTCKMNAVYIGDYNPKSPAHQHIRLAVRYLDSVLTRVSEPSEIVGTEDGVTQIPVETVEINPEQDHL